MAVKNGKKAGNSLRRLEKPMDSIRKTTFISHIDWKNLLHTVYTHELKGRAKHSYRLK